MRRRLCPWICRIHTYSRARTHSSRTVRTTMLCARCTKHTLTIGLRHIKRSSIRYLYLPRFSATACNIVLVCHSIQCIWCADTVNDIATLWTRTRGSQHCSRASVSVCVYAPLCPCTERCSTRVCIESREIQEEIDVNGMAGTRSCLCVRGWLWRVRLLARSFVRSYGLDRFIECVARQMFLLAIARFFPGLCVSVGIR